MDSINNPYSPGAGAPPPELVGRDPILSQAEILLGRIRVGKPEKSLLLTGLRGVGKTVLLNELEKKAENSGYQTISIEVHEDKPLIVLLVASLRALLFKLDRMGGFGNKAKRAFAVLKSFVSAIKISYGEITLALDIEAELGSADSGDLEIDLPQLFVAVGEAALEKNCAIAILIDEIQYLSIKELGALIMAMHKIQQSSYPCYCLEQDCPFLPGLAGESKSYAERLFNFPIIGELSREDAYKALRDMRVSLQLSSMKTR